MTTKKKSSAVDSDSKDDPVRQAVPENEPPEAIWARLDDLQTGFRQAAAISRSEDLAKMSHILRWLGEAPEFREIAHASLRTYLGGAKGARAMSRQDEEFVLLGGVNAALRTAPQYLEDDAVLGSASPAHRRFLSQVVTTTILGLLPICSKLYGRTTCPPLPADPVRLLWDDRDQYQETIERVEDAIAAKLADPQSVDAKALVRTAMRALGVEADYVKHMFRKK